MECSSNLSTIFQQKFITKCEIILDFRVKKIVYAVSDVQCMIQIFLEKVTWYCFYFFENLREKLIVVFDGILTTQICRFRWN